MLDHDDLYELSLIACVFVIFIFATAAENIFPNVFQLNLDVFSTLVGLTFISRQIKIENDREQRRVKKDELLCKRESAVRLFQEYKRSIGLLRMTVRIDGSNEFVRGKNVIRYLNTIYQNRNKSGQSIFLGLPIQYAETLNALSEIDNPTISGNPTSYLSAVKTSSKEAKIEDIQRDYHVIYECSSFLDVETIGTLYDRLGFELSELQSMTKKQGASFGIPTLIFSSHEIFMFELREKVRAFRSKQRNLPEDTQFFFQ